MIEDTILWSSLFLSLLFFQYLIAEQYLILKKGYERIGYGLSIMLEICCIVLSCYLIVFTGYLDFLGIGFLVVTLFFSFKFIDRSHKRHKKK